ncbi:MAG: hypothetical protein POH28_04465 [Acidocella sp.]|nr:hypothetical protein [Acidocella sp.]
MSVRRKLSVLRDSFSHMQRELSKGHVDLAQHIAASIEHEIEDWYLDSLRIHHNDRHKYRLPNAHCPSFLPQQEAAK